MERKSQNLEYSQKLSAKSEESLERRSHNLFAITRPLCASGGDIGVAPESMHCNSKNSSYLSVKTKASEEHFAEAEEELTEDSHATTKHTHSDGSNSLEIKQSFNASTKRKGAGVGVKRADGSKLKAELSKYKKELKEYNHTTKDLEEKYLKINYELNEMQVKHDRFVASRKHEPETFSDSSSSTGSEFSLKRKYTQVFHRGSSFMTMLPPNPHDNLSPSFNPKQSPEHEVNLVHKKRISSSKHHQPQSSSTAAEQPSRHSYHGAPAKHSRHHKRKTVDLNKENEPPLDATTVNYHHGRHQTAGLKDIYKVLKNVLDTNQKSQTINVNKGGIDLKELQTTITTLQHEQQQFRNIIQQQQSCLHDYHSRCIKAQHIMQTQQIEIEKLNSNNQQLETEISAGIDQLRFRIDSKLRDVSHLPQMMREEQTKYEKVSKENSQLTERLRTLQGEASQLKLKIEELGRRKTMTINRLKATERDLKIFKNYNTALKHEKRKLNEELQKLKEQFETVQNSSKRTMSRQREQNEKQRRDLQKRVFELELKLSRSQNSTTSLIQERDSLIAELQTQLNTLVHNFEVSQKHIRVLRRHIYSMSGGNMRSNSRLLNEAV